MAKKKKSNRGGARPGSGPKPRMENGRAVTIRLGDEHLLVLNAYCKEHGLTRSGAIRGLIDAAR